MSTTRRPGCLLILGRLLICDGVSGADDDAVSVLSRMGMLPRLLLASHTLLGQSPEQWLAYLLNKNISVSNEGSYQGARGWLVGWAWLLAVAGSWVDGHARKPFPPHLVRSSFVMPQPWLRAASHRPMSGGGCWHRGPATAPTPASWVGGIRPGVRLPRRSMSDSPSGAWPGRWVMRLLQGRGGCG